MAAAVVVVVLVVVVVVVEAVKLRYNKTFLSHRQTQPFMYI
jgi:hypothetical protein